jgi:hypothetical protein
MTSDGPGSKRKAIGHVGLEPFLEQRQRLLADFDSLRIEGQDDATFTAHGLGAEGVYREWLETFLPKRFGVTKGYVITANPDYNANLEEWDVLIYDQLSSPVLFVRDFDGTDRRAIPVEYVRHVIEVKATLTPESASQASDKLQRLKPMLGLNDPRTFPLYLSDTFTCSCVFFDLGKTTKEQYKKALDNLLPLYQLKITWNGLILRGAKNPDWGGFLSFHVLDLDQAEGLLDFIAPESSWIQGSDGRKWEISCGMNVGRNAFQEYHFNLIRALEGKLMSVVPSLYGRDMSGASVCTLF